MVDLSVALGPRAAPASSLGFGVASEAGEASSGVSRLRLADTEGVEGGGGETDEDEEEAG